MEQKLLTASIAAMYWGCDVKTSNKIGKIVSINEKHLSISDEGEDFDLGSITGYYYQDCQLLLTPLSQITDEDAIEMAIDQAMNYECHL
jgi:hypothetical protein